MSVLPAATVPSPERTPAEVADEILDSAKIFTLRAGQIVEAGGARFVLKSDVQAELWLHLFDPEQDAADKALVARGTRQGNTQYRMGPLGNPPSDSEG